MTAFTINLHRSVEQPKFEYRDGDDADDGRIGTLEGYTAVFNVRTEIDEWGYRYTEEVKPGAFARTLQGKGANAKILFNHGRDLSVGRNVIAAPDEVREDSYGLYLRAGIIDTDYNRDRIVPQLRAGVLGASFMFDTVDDKWLQNDGELDHRDLLEVKLHEHGPVTFPAYEDAGLGVRSAMANLDALDPAQLAALNERLQIADRPERGTGGTDSDDAVHSGHTSQYLATQLRSLQLQGLKYR